MALSGYASSLIAAFLSCIFFGFYVSVALRTSVILWTRYKAKRSMHPYLVITHILLALLVTTHTVAVMVRAMLPIVQQTYALRDVWTKDTVFVDALWMISLVISDAFICYRTYVVWDRNIYTQIIPILILCVNVVILVLRLRIEGDSALGSTNPVKYFDELGDMSMIFEVLTLVLNLLNTGMIAYRIWSVRKRTQSSRMVKSDTISNLVTLLIESAAVYTVVLVVDIVFLSLGNILLLVFIDIQTPIIGIVFSNIIISVTEGSAFGASSGTTGNGTSRDRVIWTRATMRNGGPVPTEINMQTIISTHIDRMETRNRERDIDKSYMDFEMGVLPTSERGEL
ncbi:hypothetical protein BT96DRAFT_998545 [Gymnopus androsaceus JB14]|uniref:G-protein coupled receptors family 1 profile domain-containing protein n=1 Tax=Gymnopus androsaceus JB14 TaxID=1447944 RepID=A0A6A4H866_9AGAR|nr:hypothetical protein BT96DRAFT_998545 [Gymnopus androsaceus JB14]